MREPFHGRRMLSRRNSWSALRALKGLETAGENRFLEENSFHSKREKMPMKTIHRMKCRTSKTPLTGHCPDRILALRELFPRSPATLRQRRKRGPNIGFRREEERKTALPLAVAFPVALDPPPSRLHPPDHRPSYPLPSRFHPYPFFSDPRALLHPLLESVESPRQPLRKLLAVPRRPAQALLERFLSTFRSAETPD